MSSSELLKLVLECTKILTEHLKEIEGQPDYTKVFDEHMDLILFAVKLKTQEIQDIIDKTGRREALKAIKEVTDKMDEALETVTDIKQNVKVISTFVGFINVVINGKPLEIIQAGSDFMTALNPPEENPPEENSNQ